MDMGQSIDANSIDVVGNGELVREKEPQIPVAVRSLDSKRVLGVYFLCSEIVSDTCLSSRGYDYHFCFYFVENVLGFCCD